MADVARRARVQHRRDAEEFLAIGRPLEALQESRAAATISEQLIAASTGGVVDFVLDCILIMDARAWMHQSEGIKEEALRASFLLQGAARRAGSFTASELETFGYATTSLLRHLIEHDMYSQVAALVETSAAVFDRLGPAHHLSRTLMALTTQHAKEDASNAVTRSHRAPVSDPSHHDLPSSPTFGPPRPPAADTSSDDSADDAEVRVHAQARRAADMRDKGDALYDAGLSFRMSGNISSAIKSLVAARAAFEVARNGFVSFGNTVEAGEITQQVGFRCHLQVFSTGCQVGIHFCHRVDGNLGPSASLPCDCVESEHHVQVPCCCLHADCRPGIVACCCLLWSTRA